jgi:uncharacterized zinc-type alcohol dehydrogenase-like protein
MSDLTFRAMAAPSPGADLVPHEYTLGDPGHDEVDVEVLTCGICHSDIEMIENNWQMSSYPFVPGHEITGRILRTGSQVSHLKPGQLVGVGWFSRSCLTCPTCSSGDLNLCPNVQGTIVGRQGGFATHVRVQSNWAIPLPEGLDPTIAGPLFCGGITVFNPIVQCGVRPTDRVGVVGIGGLGHLALKFLNKWGCEVIAFSSNPAKHAECLRLGAHRVVDSTKSEKVAALAGSLNFILITAQANLDWSAYITALAPRGRIHIVAALTEPIPVSVFPFIIGQKSLSASPRGSPATTTTMLNFPARHGIAPVTETFPLSRVNEALNHLKAGKARYRVVLTNDLA